MNNHIYRTAVVTGVLLAALIVISAFLPVRVFAGENIPVTVDIKITYIVDGNAGKAGGDRFTLTADDPGAPMPAGTVDGKKTITVKEEGSYGFGDIRFESPEVFWYTITREVTEKKGVVKDSPVYRAKVIALNNGHGYVLIYKNGSSEKTESVYKDRVSPVTGDDSVIIIYAGMMAAAAAALTVFAAAGRRNRKKEVQSEAEKTIP